MNAESWTELNRLLDEALDLPPAVRARWLASGVASERVSAPARNSPSGIRSPSGRTDGFVVSNKSISRRTANAARPLAASRIILGRMLNDIGRPRDAEPILAKALGGFENLGPKHPEYADALCELTRARLLQGASASDRERIRGCLAIYRGWGLAERDVVAALEALTAADPQGRAGR